MNASSKSLQFIHFFRQASPYINQHRGKVFVFCIQEDKNTFSALKSLLHDIAILHALGSRIVIVFGVQDSLKKYLPQQKQDNKHLIIHSKNIQVIQKLAGAKNITIQSILSMGLANSPMHGASIQSISGNFILAKPVGIRSGIDYGLTGEIRKIRTKLIKKHLNNNQIIVIPPLGYSITGEVFYLPTEEIASAVAIKLNADKIIFFDNNVKKSPLLSQEGQAITAQKACNLAKQQRGTAKKNLLVAAKTCRKGVNRAHIIPQNIDGGILAELYSRDGFGLMITNEAYDRIEQATINDIPSLLELIRPLEKAGVLVRRSRKLLEMEIECFTLLKRDNTVIGCAALYPYPEEKMAELGCVVINPDYQKNGFADILLQHAEKLAYNQGIKQLFCLTTHTSHWFMERGFTLATLNQLPQKKQNSYNPKRNSKPYFKKIKAPSGL